MKRPEVTLKSGPRFAEIYSADGTGGVLYSLLNPETMEAYHRPTNCKDFFTDAFYSEATGRDTSIWGFKWKPGTMPKTRGYEMALEYKPEAKFGDKADAVGDFLHKWEKSMEIPLSTVRADTSGKLIVVGFDEAWPVRPVMVSLLTLLMRLGPSYDGTPVLKFIDRIVKHGNPYGVYDKGELGKAKVVPMLEKIFESGEAPFPAQTFAQYSDPHGCHHSGGLIAFTTGKATG